MEGVFCTWGQPWTRLSGAGEGLGSSARGTPKPQAKCTGLSMSGAAPGQAPGVQPAEEAE